MAETRLVPGERLAARLAARAVRRPRVGVSSRFYARFGLGDPWSEEIAGQETPWGFWGMHGARHGALGLLWDLLERRFLRYLRFGVVFHGGLGGLYSEGWGDWLPLVEGFSGLWRERDLAAFGRLPGAGRRRWLPWGAYSTPQFSFVLAPVEEVEPEEPAHGGRFRRRPRRRRAVAAGSPALALPAFAPRPQVASAALPGRPAVRAAPEVAPSARPARSVAPEATFVARPSYAADLDDGAPGLAAPARRRAGPSGIARALLRRDAPAVGTPAL
ncbi:MAG: hypothetical protein ABIO70_11340, partial [Pseudomonadota bacterium]